MGIYEYNTPLLGAASHSKLVGNNQPRSCSLRITEHEIGRRTDASLAVLQASYWIVVVKKALIQKANILLHRSIYVPTHNWAAGNDQKNEAAALATEKGAQHRCSHEFTPSTLCTWLSLPRSPRRGGHFGLQCLAPTRPQGRRWMNK